MAATTAAAPPLAHAPWPGQRVKDAIVDRLRDTLGARPDVSRDDPDLRVYVQVAEDRRIDVGLDVSGESLHPRGHRVASTPAPLRETLAAALRAMRVAPRIVTARRFGFERWPAFRDAARARWGALVEEARGRVLPRAPAALVGRDRDPDAVAAARANAARLDAPGVRAFWRRFGATLRRLDGHTAGALTATLARFELGRAAVGARRRDA